MNKKIEEALNTQMNFELYSAFVYKSMAAYCDSLDMPGFANWYQIQFKEELSHADKIYDFLVERGGRPFFEKIDAPQKEWKSLKDSFEDALKHEQEVTSRINKIMSLALKEEDHATRSFLNWFVDEQVEEEAAVDSIIKQLNLIKDSGHGLFMMEKDMAARVFVDPASEN